MGKLSDDLATLSTEAYVYLLPLVTMGVSRRQSVNAPPGSRPGLGPVNEFHHIREFPAADFRAVVRPNFDTLYSSAWLDLTAGPVTVQVPDTDDRYYMLPMLDMWTDVFASPGKRTSGTAAGEYVVVGPGYDGPVPPGAAVIAAPTPYVWVIGRTQTNGPADYPAVRRVQDGYRIVASAPTPHRIDPTVDTTTDVNVLIDRMTAIEFFAYATELLAEIPAHPTDFSVLARIAGLGIVPGRPFDATRFTDDDLSRVEDGVRAARAALPSALPTMGRSVNGWTVLAESMGVYGNAYLRRAVVALMGLGANPPEDAIYPVLLADADGAPVVGDHDYVVHFDADALPPVAAFWSITMYDAEGFQVANEIDRFAIGDRDDLRENADGSLDIYIQHAHPGPDRVANWLPSPAGPVGITMRLYAPAPEALDGRWAPPPVRRVG